jgi:2-methylcitrate dehydratase PrpD
MGTQTTRELAQFVVDSRWEGVPQIVRHEAVRATVNWLACAIGGCRDDTVDRLLGMMREFAGAPQATLLGRGERLDALSVAWINGTGSNRLDFDDTHLRTVIHPTVPIAAALFALAELRPMTGAQYLHAFALGVDVECRIGNAISPEHYDSGWQITATCGVIGAAAAAGKVLGLDLQQMMWAFGIAATHSSGLMSMLGTMCKSYNMGHAARNGLAAALLAQRGFTSAEGVLETHHGFLDVLSRRHDAAEITRELGTRWELLENAYKPYPCGIVNHPVIDACLDLRAAQGIDAARIASVEISVNPLALRLCGFRAPRDSLEAKLSLYHCAAVAFVDGAAGVREFTDERVHDPSVVDLCRRVAVVTDEAIGKQQARARVTLVDGTQHELFVPEARGSLARPVTDAELAAKFRTLAATELAPDAVERLLAQCLALADLPEAAVLARGSVGGAAG